MAGLDAQALERELAGHPMLGDTRAILDRTRTHALMQLEALSRSRPFARELWRELRKQGGRRAVADILDDPVVRRSSRSLLRAIRRGERSTSDEAEEVFAAVLQHLRHGPPGLPVAAGCPHRFRSGRSGQSITVWDPGVPETVVTRTFSAFVDDCFSEHFAESRTRHLQRPEPAFVDAVRRGCDLLAILLPELSASALDHVRLVGVLVDQQSRSLTFPDMPSTMFISGAAVETPWRAAEYLLHEGAHSKMGNIASIQSIYGPAVSQAGSPTIRAIWHGPDAAWPVTRAWGLPCLYAPRAFLRACRTYGRILGRRLRNASGLRPPRPGEGARPRRLPRRRAGCPRRTGLRYARPEVLRLVAADAVLLVRCRCAPGACRATARRLRWIFAVNTDRGEREDAA